MQCMTCKADIPPQWVAAIQKNECPGCSGPIMDDASKELLIELKEAMAKMPNDCEGLAGWLLSNYHLQKIGTAEPTSFHRKPSERPAQQGRKLKIAENKVQEFLKRKDPSIAKSIANQKDFAEIAEQINSGEISEDQYGNEEELDFDTDEVLEDEEISEDDSDAYEEAEYNRRNFKSKAKRLARTSLIVPGSERPLSPAETASMMHSVAERGQGFDSNDSMPEALQAARFDRLKKQRAISGGGTEDFGSGKGTFRRGG